MTKAREVVALDAKVTIDGNALYRHPDTAEFRNEAAEDPQEPMAHERGPPYVKLDGTSGSSATGAGLVMSTLDVLAQAAARRPTSWTRAAAPRPRPSPRAVEVILSTNKVKAVLQHLRRITRATRWRAA